MIVGTAYENYDVYTIMDFSALVVINYIDSYYYAAVRDELKTEIEHVKFTIPVSRSSRKWSKLNIWEKIQSFLISFAFNTYELIYYHFMPYLGLAYSFFIVKQT